MRSDRPVARESALAALALSLLYLVFHQRTWSLDGVLHTLASVRPNDVASSGHVLLRPVAWGWTRLLSAGGPLTFAARYDALEVLFGVLGVASLVLMFAVVRRRVGAWPAWLALAGVAMMRCTERQITTLDEKPLGMFLFALAVTATDRTLARVLQRERAPRLTEVLPMGLAWVLAVAGHLQNAPFAAASLLSLVVGFRGPARLAQACAFGARLVPLLALAGVVLLVLVQAGSGGVSALPELLEHLFVHRPASPAPPSFVALIKDTGLGWMKAFFLVDRLSPHWAPPAAAAGFGWVMLAIAAGLRRRPDPLAVALAAGSAGLMVLIPLANFFPDYGDSYTMVVMAAIVPLASAPRALIAAATVSVLAVNTPAASSYSWPETTMQLQLGRMIREQTQRDAPWVLIEELSTFGLEQGLAQPYYAMCEPLRSVPAALDRLPPGPFLLELPQPIERDGRVLPGRVEGVRARLAARGRTARAARLCDPLRTVRSDFRRYGEYLIVEPARLPIDPGHEPPAGRTP